MNRHHIMLTALSMLLLAVLACGSRQPSTADTDPVFQPEEGDRTIYALACDGCTDTVVVFLAMPYSGQNPDTLSVLQAMEKHQVFGHPRIGDKLAIMRDTADTTRASQVVVVEDLTGSWSYEVLPELRERAGGMVIDDSLREMLLKPRVYTLMIKNDRTVANIGMQRKAMTTDEHTPVVYPEARHYGEWAMHNGKLVLKETARDSLGNMQQVGADTAELVTLTPDTLVLRFAHGQQGYFRSEGE